MRQILIALFFFALHSPASAWNAAGHRLVAVIAWRQMSTPAQKAVLEALSRHPDYERWREKSRTAKAVNIFAEASIWPDDIRNDPRFYDEEWEPATVASGGLIDTARHKRWHYVDLSAAGKVESGELDRQIERLSKTLKSAASEAQISHAMPWLIHLVADIHQPLHVGMHRDEGGNQVEIENPFNKRLPFSNLHLYWDDLPGPHWLRGKRLEKKAAQLLDQHGAPTQGDVVLWRTESHRLLVEAYPNVTGSLLPIISDDFQRRSREIAERRIVEAGYRLGRLLESIFDHRVSRETP